MLLPKNIQIFFAPGDAVAPASIVELTSTLFASAMAANWWNDPVLNTHALRSIDRNWRWFDPVDLDGIPLASMNLAVVTPDGQVQGAMILSTDFVQSQINQRQRCLFVDQICTAPRNRPNIRKDNSKHYQGVGTSLLKWAAELSIELGHGGKLFLLSSPEGESTYQWLGFRNFSVAPKTIDGVKYNPMELPLESVKELLKK